MRIPDGVMKTVRGPLLAAMVAGCSSTAAPADPPPTQPIAPTPLSETENDPVSYDARAETERLARVDESLTASERMRDRRIEDEDEARERRQRQQNPFGSLIGIGHMPNERWLAACGRG